MLAWKESQKKYHRLIEEGFAPVPISDVPLLEQEVVGIPMLGAMADALYGGDDPTKVFFRGQVHDIQKEDGRYVLTLPLPFTSKEEISLMQSGDEITVQVASVRRNVILPRSLLGLPVSEAKMDEDKLKIIFHRGRAKGNNKGSK